MTGKELVEKFKATPTEVANALAVVLQNMSLLVGYKYVMDEVNRLLEGGKDEGGISTIIAAWLRSGIDDSLYGQLERGIHQGPR